MVQIEFVQSAFTAAEAAGSVSVCITVTGAILDRDVTVLLSTQDNTAMCESL